MPKDRDRAPNPATAQLKADKQKALKKAKTALAAQRTERYASRNPTRLERTIENLKAERDAKGGKLGGREQKMLEEAERDLGRVRKARERVGDRGGDRGGGGERGGSGSGSGRGRGKGGGRGEGGGRGGFTGLLGKRGREGDGEGEEGGSSGDETDESVRNIPWPRDTPPPIPPQYRRQQPRNTTSTSTNANSEPLGTNARFPPHSRKGEGKTEAEAEAEGNGQVPNTSLPPKPPHTQAKTTYASAPIIRDLRKEATERFVPAAVRRKIEAKKGRGGRLLEEEEVRELEMEGYGTASGGIGGEGEWGRRGGEVGGEGKGKEKVGGGGGEI